MKTLNNFEIEMPLLTMDGGIPLKGYAFYVSFDNKTYYGAEFDKMTITLFERVNSGTRYYDYHSVIYFHCANGNFSASFYKGKNGDAICAVARDIATNTYIPFSFYASRNDIEFVYFHFWGMVSL